MTFYAIATGICVFIGTLILFLTNNIYPFYFFTGIGFLWLIAGCVVSDLKEKK